MNPTYFYMLIDQKRDFSSGMPLELYLFLWRNLVNVRRNEIKTQCVGSFLIYAEKLSLAETSTCQKEKKTIVFQT